MALTNKAAVKAFILENAQRLRPGWDCTRVAREALENYDRRLAAMIRADIRSHPSGCGKTFRP